MIPALTPSDSTPFALYAPSLSTERQGRVSPGDRAPRPSAHTQGAPEGVMAGALKWVEGGANRKGSLELLRGWRKRRHRGYHAMVVIRAEG